MRRGQRASEPNAWSEAVFVGLAAAGIVIIVIKLLTGLAFAPLAAIALLVLVLMTALRVRQIRTHGRTERPGQ